MNYGGHVASSFVSFGLLYYIASSYALLDFTYLQWSYALLIILFFGLLPDIDQSESNIGKWILTELILIALTSLVIYLVIDSNLALLICILTLLVLVPIALSKHRGWFHSLSAGLVLSLPLFYFTGWEYGCIAFYGYLTHLVADQCIKLY